jgi:hypothetical protein
MEDDSVRAVHRHLHAAIVLPDCDLNPC